MSIKREDLVVGAEFIENGDGSSHPELRVVQFVGENIVVYKMGNHEYSIFIREVLRAWAPKPNPPEVRYLNIYKDTVGHPYNTRWAADLIAGCDRVACIRIEYKEGQFDD